MFWKITNASHISNAFMALSPSALLQARYSLLQTVLRETLGARPTSVTTVSLVMGMWPHSEQAASKASPSPQLLSSKHNAS